MTDATISSSAWTYSMIKAFTLKTASCIDFEREDNMPSDVQKVKVAYLMEDMEPILSSKVDTVLF